MEKGKERKTAKKRRSASFLFRSAGTRHFPAVTPLQKPEKAYDFNRFGTRARRSAKRRNALSPLIDTTADATLAEAVHTALFIVKPPTRRKLTQETTT